MGGLATGLVAQYMCESATRSGTEGIYETLLSYSSKKNARLIKKIRVHILFVLMSQFLILFGLKGMA